MGFLKKIDWLKIAEWIAEAIIVLSSMIIWFPVTCYKYGMVFSDNVVKKFIEDDKGRK